MSVVQGFSGNSQEILTSDFPCSHKPVGFSVLFLFFCMLPVCHVEKLNNIILKSVLKIKNNYQEVNKMFVFI